MSEIGKSEKSVSVSREFSSLASSRVVGVHFGNPTPKLRPSGPRPSPRAPDGQDPAHQHGIRPSLSQNLHEEKIGDHIICPRLPSGHCPPGYRARPRHVGAPAPPVRPRRAAVWGGMAIWLVRSILDPTILRSYLARLLTDSPSCNPFQVWIDMFSA